jgi:hypothetical protein
MPTPHGSDSVESGPEGTTILVCLEEKDWVPRKGCTRLSSEHPGTAVLWEDAMWEVLEAGREGGAVRYRLGAWDDRHVVRVRVAYDEETENRRALAAHLSARGARRRDLLTAAAPLTGLLPGAVQARWEKELGVNAARITIVSTILPFVVGTTVAVLLLAAAFGGPGLPRVVAPLAWFFPESVFRFGIAMSQGKPVGSVVGSVAWFLWRGLRGGK